MKLGDLLGIGDSDPVGGSSSDDDVHAKDRPMEPHAVLEGGSDAVIVVVVDERKRRLANIPLRLLAKDGTTIDQTTDEDGVARWDDLSTDQTWQLTTPEAPSEMRRQSTLGFVSLMEDDEDGEDDEDEDDEDEDDEEEEDAEDGESAGESPAGLGGGGIGLGGGLGGFGDAAAPSAPSGGGLMGAVTKAVSGLLGGAVSLGGSVSIGGSVGGSIGGGATGGAAGDPGSSSFGFGFGGADDAASGDGETPDHVVPDDFDPLAGPELTHVAVVTKVKVTTGDSLDTLASAAGLVADDVGRFNWDTTDAAEIQSKLRWEVGCATDGDYADNLQLDDNADPGVLYVPRALDQPVEVGKRYKLRGCSVQPFFLILKNQVERPIPEAKYTLSLADGSTRRGALGQHGIGLVESPPWGTVTVEYDDPADLRAKALAGDAREAIEARDPDALYAVLSQDPDELRAAVDAYNDYFNDFTGEGLTADISAIVSDPDQRIGIDLLLGYIDETLGEGGA